MSEQSMSLVLMTDQPMTIGNLREAIPNIPEIIEGFVYANGKKVYGLEIKSYEPGQFALNFKFYELDGI